ncbi:MAG: DUF1934 family protein [Clostridia bacterium]|nr:DUF1934 family protein [Clostridia bacterium]
MPDTICENGTLLSRGDKALLKLTQRRIQIEKKRVLIFQNGYTLELNCDKETDLLYPTPYGTLSMRVKTKKLNIDGENISAKYALYTADSLIHYVTLKLETERI